MNFIPPDFTPASSEIFMLIMVCVVMLADLTAGDNRRYVAYLLTQITLLGCALLTYISFSTEITHTFNGMYVDDTMADILKLMVYGTVSAVLVYSHTYISDRGMLKGEFFSLILFATMGMMVMISASHFLTLYIGLELLSLSLYALVALRRDSLIATEAAMKFFVLGALASGFLLYGMSMVYGATGTLHVSQLAQIIQSEASSKEVATSKTAMGGIPKYSATKFIVSSASQPFSSCAIASADMTADCFCSTGYLAISRSILLRDSALNIVYLSISPNTISCVPIIATTSEIMCPLDISSKAARCANPGARIFNR